jgi:hypothetical protein
MEVYAILILSEDGIKLLPHYFTTYKKALDAVKEAYPDRDDRLDEDGTPNKYRNNKVDVIEGHKMNESTEPNQNITELYIERGIHIYIHKLLVKPKSASGGYSNSRRRHAKKNTNNSRKHRL